MRFYAKNAPQLRITRYYDTSAENVDRLFWVVETPDGTRYRLGFTADAEEWQHIFPNAYLEDDGDGHIGYSSYDSAIAWHVDTVTDAFGNQMQYRYNQKTIDEDFGNVSVNTRKTRIVRIEYNYPNRIGDADLPAGPLVDRLTSTPGTRIALHNIGDDLEENAVYPITRILIFHGDMSAPIKEYRLDAQGYFTNNEPCSDLITKSSALYSIRLFVNTDDNPHSDFQIQPTYALPPVSFTYTPLPHFHEGSGTCFSFPYLQTMTNGYGGQITFSYQSDNRSVGDYEYNIEWPDIGYTYFVTQTLISDGWNSSTTTYQYDTPCYGQSGGDVGSLPNAFTCPGALGEDHPEYGPIVGFAQTTITTTGYADEILPFRTVEFSQGDYYAGMVLTETIKNPINPTYWLRRTVNTLDALWQPARFAYVKTSASYLYSGSDNNNYLASKVENFYDATYQGGSQLGQLTQQDFYQWQNPTQGFVRLTQTRHHYVANTSGNYWVVRPWAQVVYDGSGTTRQALTLLYYDGATTQPQTQTPGQGKLTLSRAVVINSPISGYSDRWYSQDTLYGYDQYGNQTQVKQNSDYGQVGNQGGTVWGYTLLPGSSNEQVTTITYESGYNLYPVKVTNALNQETAFEIWGFKDKNGTLVNLLGFQEQRGLLKTIIPPTGSNNRVHYEYDPFGRLHAVYDAHDYTGFGDTSLFNGNALTIYRYWDNSWNDANAIWLNPSANQPFAISEHTRPGEYNGLGGNFVYKVFSYYDGLGRVIQTQDRGFHPETVQSTVKDIVTSTTYNVSGQPTCVTVPYAKTHVLDSTTLAFDTSACTAHDYNHIEYDDFGRPEQVFDPSNHLVMTYAYGLTTGITVDGVQRFSITRIQDANNHLVRQYHNVMGQLVLVREYEGTYGSESDYADTRYSYDLLGNLIAVGTSTFNNSQPSGWLRRSTMSYDALGRKLTMNDPDMGTWAYSYDALGNLLGQDANNGTADRDVLCFAYDKLNRLTAKRHDNTTNGCSTGDPLLASYSYIASGNGLGQIDTIQAGYALDNFDYDSRGRVITHTRTIESQVFTMVYGSYDSLNRPHTVKYPGGELLTTTYDREGENKLRSNLETSDFVSDVQYNARGQMTNLVRPNVTTNYSYWGDGTGEDKTYRLKTLQHGTTDDALPNFSFTYDAVGNIGSLSESLNGSTADSQEFRYDELNRLTDAWTTTASTHYEHEYYYDRLGNIDERHEKTCTPNCGSTWTVYNYSYGSKPDAVTSVTGQGSYSYDASGNMTSRMEGGTTYTQTFDAENRLTFVSSNSSPTTTSFGYDANGQRTTTMTVTPGATSTTTYYPFPGYEMEIQKQWQTGGGRGPGGSWVTVATIIRKTYFLAGQAVATRLSSTPTSSDDGVYYILTDHLGSTRLLTSTSGTPKTTTTTRYLPYGGYRTTPSPNELTERGYTGHHENRDIGLTYMNARFFVPYLNRFISADSIIPQPTDPQSYNRYSYARNNPINRVDPSGHEDCDADGNCQGQSTVPLPPPPTPVPAAGKCFNGGDGEICQPGPPSPPPQVTRLWIDPGNVTAIQLYGNTNFAFELDGTGPSYAYSQGFHGGLDLLASAGTEVVAGINGRVVWVEQGAYGPNYVVIEIAPDTYMVLGHLADVKVQVGQDVTPDSVVGAVADRSDVDHLHVEFWTGPGDKITPRTIEPPYHYMTPEVKTQFLGLMADMNLGDDRVTFHNRSDGMWLLYYNQPTLTYNGSNLNVGQSGYVNPWP